MGTVGSPWVQWVYTDFCGENGASWRVPVGYREKASLVSVRPTALFAAPDQRLLRNPGWTFTHKWCILYFGIRVESGPQLQQW